MTLPVGPPAAPAKTPGRGFWPLRDLPTALWLIFVVLAALIHRELPAPRWLLIHLFMLGALSHAILVWSQYFATALLKLPVTVRSKKQQSYRLALMNLGTVVVITGVLGQWWPVTTAGAVMVGSAALWHGAWMYSKLRGSLPSPYSYSVRYYIAAACFLPIGGGLGAWISTSLPSPLHERFTLAHAMINVLGWVGLTVAGTLITLWPTMLRTKIADSAAVRLRQGLPVLICSVLIAAAGAASGLLWMAGLGIAGYLAGLALGASPFVSAARRKPPRTFSTLSVLAAVSWWAGTLVWLLYALLSSDDWTAMGSLFDSIAPYLVAGFAAQILLGALSYLIPVALGGGPRAVRAATMVFDRGASWRITMANTALLVCALPVPSLVRVVASVLYLIAMASFLPLLFAALKAHRKAKKDPSSAAPPAPGAGKALTPEGDRPKGQRTGQALAGFTAVVLGVAVAVGLDPAASSMLTSAPTEAQTPGAVQSTAPVQRVQVEARDMSFSPAHIEVPSGTHLIIELHNADEGQVHDLVLATGADSGRLAPGESAEVDAGVVTEDIEGWCSIVGHRQMGMVLTISATGQPAQAEPDPDPSTSEDAGHGHHHAAGGSTVDGLDLNAKPADGFTARDAALEPLPAATGEPAVHRETLKVSEAEHEVSPGFTQQLWTFGDSAPGPTLHGRVGDRFEITLINDGTIGHSIDFHAGSLAPDEPMRTIEPGEQLTYSFTATKAGIWMYHCSTAPMSAHIANGMFGAVIIEPDDLPPVDQSFVMVQSEYYLGAQGQEVDMDKVARQNPDLVVFNGYANQYSFDPLEVKTGERIRIWVLDAGPNRPGSFHVVGGQFDTVFFEGAYQLDPERDAPGGSQALALAPAQGGFVELQLPEAGNYPFVTHYMSDAEKGAHGMLHVQD